MEFEYVEANDVCTWDTHHGRSQPCHDFRHTLFFSGRIRKHGVQIFSKLLKLLSCKIRGPTSKTAMCNSRSQTYTTRTPIPSRSARQDIMFDQFIELIFLLSRATIAGRTFSAAPPHSARSSPSKAMPQQQQGVGKSVLARTFTHSRTNE